MEISRTGILIRLITSNINNYIASKTAHTGIKHGQFEYFLFISKHEGINQKELSKLKSIGKASVTKAIKILVQNDLIERIVDENDKRNFKLYITDKGKSYIEEFKSFRDEIENTVFYDFSQKEKAALNSMLEKMYRNSNSLVK